jgi:DNA-directed RNA polymerase specialized sigma24 family protein
LAKELVHEVWLLKGSVHGDTKAYGCIVEKHSWVVSAITLGATCDVQKSEELAREVFIRAWNELASLKNLTDFGRWLIGIARDAAKNSPANEDDTVAEGTMNLLRRVPADCREMAVLYYREGRSVPSVAAQLGLPTDAVEGHISQARAALGGDEKALEDELNRTAPGEAFTAAVISSANAANSK